MSANTFLGCLILSTIHTRFASALVLASANEVRRRYVSRCMASLHTHQFVTLLYTLDTMDGVV